MRRGVVYGERLLHDCEWCPHAHLHQNARPILRTTSLMSPGCRLSLTQSRYSDVILSASDSPVGVAISVLMCDEYAVLSGVAVLMRLAQFSDLCPLCPWYEAGVGTMPPISDHSDHYVRRMKQEEWGDDGSGESLPTTSPSYSSLPDARMEEAANLLGTSTLPTPHFDTPLRLTPAPGRWSGTARPGRWCR